MPRTTNTSVELPADSNQWDETPDDGVDAGEIAAVLELLRGEIGFDLADYKQSTLVRRIQRRMAFRQIDRLADYRTLLAGEAAEREALAEDLLIGVTAFYRDPEVFQYLATSVLPELLRDRSPRHDLRIWSAGCATGEEAYTLALLALEAAERSGFEGAVKVFATDIQQRSLDLAARGVFSAEAMAVLPESCRERWFRPEADGSWRISPEVRRNVVFARHNLLVDPPFTRIDLAVCRNLLIYLKPAAQRRALAQIHFALQPNGCLLLGSSETVGDLEGSEFAAQERGRRLFRKLGDNRPRHLAAVATMPTGPQFLGGDGGVVDRRLLRDYDHLLKRYMPPGMLVDGERRVLHWFGDLTPFLRPPEGRAEEDVLQQVREPLQSALGVALLRSAEIHGQATAEGIPLELSGEQRLVNIGVDCIPDDRSHVEHFHVTFDLLGAEAAAASRIVAGGYRVGVEQELQAVRDRLHHTIMELQASNERLDLANEELTASNEELQSTNEELKSVNEDLYSLNAELEGRNAELAQLNRDYDNLLASTEMGMVFLDSRLNIRRFNPPVTAFLQLLPQDIGRPIAHIAYHLAAREDLLTDLRAVLADGCRVERELEADGRHYLKRVLPFRDETGRQDGVVLTFTDITAIRTAEAEREHLKSILDAMPDGVYIVNEGLDIEYINPALEREFGPVQGRKCHDYFHGLPGQCDWCKNPEVLAGQAVRWEWTSPRGRTYDLFDMPFRNPDGSVSKLEIFHDVTEQKAAVADLCQAEARQRSILAAMNEGVILWDTVPRLVLANEAARRILGLAGDPAGLGGEVWQGAVGEDGAPCAAAELPLARVLAGGQRVLRQVLGLPQADGSMRWLQVNAEPVGEGGALAGVVTSFADISHLKEVEGMLGRARDYYLSLLQNFPALIRRSGPDGRCDYVNQTWLEFTGRSLAQELGDGWSEGVHPDDAAGCLAAYRDRCSAREPFVLEYRLRRRDGEYRWLIDIGRPFTDVAGEFAGYLGACFDVSERREAEDRLRLASRVFEESGEGIIITDAERRIIEVNRGFTRITGYSAAEALGRHPRFLASGRHDRPFFEAMEASLRERDYWHGEIWDRRKNGEVYPEWLGISVVRDAAGRISHYLGIFTDITERKASEARIEYMAHHDGLTGLPNRSLFRERFAMAVAYALRSGSKAALLLIDLDRFKAINDSLGHGVGDDLLRGVAKRLQESVRDTDTVSRQGGDEFLVVLSDLHDIDAIGQVVGKMLEAGERPFFIQGQEVGVSLSVGVAVCPDDGEDFDTLLKMAETAMYHAKEAGRNTYRFFDQRMNVDAVARLQTTTGLRHALVRNEFRLYYQPQIDIASGRVIGVEALIRWLHPEKGLVPPAQFIPVAEDSGLIVPIGEWVLNEACRQAVAWQRAGRPELTMAVNLSAIQFRRGDIEQTVMGALARSGLEPRYLELELTESLLLTNTEHVLATVQRLKSLGLKLSIDDFGTGYSSLAYLKRFAVDRLKIDQSFVRDMASDSEAASIVRAIIQMARSLNLRTVSEGVEDERLLDYLRVLRCDEAQGYYFARPMPAAELESWLDTRP